MDTENTNNTGKGGFNFLRRPRNKPIVLPEEPLKKEPKALNTAKKEEPNIGGKRHSDAGMTREEMEDYKGAIEEIRGNILGIPKLFERNYIDLDKKNKRKDILRGIRGKSRMDPRRPTFAFASALGAILLMVGVPLTSSESGSPDDVLNPPQSPQDTVNMLKEAAAQQAQDAAHEGITDSFEAIAGTPEELSAAIQKFLHGRDITREHDGLDIAIKDYTFTGASINDTQTLIDDIISALHVALPDYTIMTTQEIQDMAQQIGTAIQQFETWENAHGVDPNFNFVDFISDCVYYNMEIAYLQNEMFMKEYNDYLAQMTAELQPKDHNIAAKEVPDYATNNALNSVKEHGLILTPGLFAIFRKDMGLPAPVVVEKQLYKVESFGNKETGIDGIDKKEINIVTDYDIPPLDFGG